MMKELKSCKVYVDENENKVRIVCSDILEESEFASRFLWKKHCERRIVHVNGKEKWIEDVWFESEARIVESIMGRFEIIPKEPDVDAYDECDEEW